MALAAAPDGQFAVFSPHSGCGVGLDVTLVHGGGTEFPLHDYVGIFEPLFGVSQLEEEVVGDVGGFFCIVVVAQPAGTDVGVF